MPGPGIGLKSRCKEKIDKAKQDIKVNSKKTDIIRQPSLIIYYIALFTDLRPHYFSFMSTFALSLWRFLNNCLADCSIMLIFASETLKIIAMLLFSSKKKNSKIEKTLTLKDVREAKHVLLFKALDQPIQSKCLFTFAKEGAPILEVSDSPDTEKKCKDYYELAKTTKTPFVFYNCKEKKKYYWTGESEFFKPLDIKDVPANWDIVICALMNFQQTGLLRHKHQHAYIYKLLKQKELGPGCEELTMEDYLEKLHNLDNKQYYIPSVQSISKYIPLHDTIDKWTLSYGDLKKAQKFALSFVEEYYKLLEGFSASR